MPNNYSRHNKGKREAQTFEEMLTDMEAAKEKGLSPVGSGQSIYKAKSGEYQEDKLRELVTISLNEMAEIATKERISLQDADEVKKRTVIYLRACVESGTFPSNLGLARSMGYSARALRQWVTQHSNTDTGRWLDLFSDMCADVISQSALKNNANSIVSIFLTKALYGYNETTNIVVGQAQLDDDEEYDVEKIRQQYLSCYSDRSDDNE